MSVVASAAPTDQSDSNTSRGSRMNQGSAGVIGRPDDSRLLSLFETYYPEGLSDFEALQAEHRAFHEGQAAIRAVHKEDVDAARSEIKAQFEAIRDALDSGEITLEEATANRDAIRSSLDDIKAEATAMKSAISEIIANKQVEVDAINALRATTRTTIVEALAADPVDEATIQSALATVSDLLDQHLAVDYKYAEQIANLLD